MRRETFRCALVLSSLLPGCGARTGLETDAREDEPRPTPAMDAGSRDGGSSDAASSATCSAGAPIDIVSDPDALAWPAVTAADDPHREVYRAFLAFTRGGTDGTLMATFLSVDGRTDGAVWTVGRGVGGTAAYDVNGPDFLVLWQRGATLVSSPYEAVSGLPYDELVVGARATTTMRPSRSRNYFTAYGANAAEGAFLLFSTPRGEWTVPVDGVDPSVATVALMPVTFLAATIRADAVELTWFEVASRVSGPRVVAERRYDVSGPPTAARLVDGVPDGALVTVADGPDGAVVQETLLLGDASQTFLHPGASAIDVWGAYDETTGWLAAAASVEQAGVSRVFFHGWRGRESVTLELTGPSGERVRPHPSVARTDDGTFLVAWEGIDAAGVIRGVIVRCSE